VRLYELRCGMGRNRVGAKGCVGIRDWAGGRICH